MSTGAKDIHRLRDWDDEDYSEGFSEYLSEQDDSVGDVYDTLICRTCNKVQVRTVWHAGFDRFIQVVLPFDKYRCKSCRATRWHFNHFRGFTASTFVLYAVSLALVLFFGTTTLGILLDRQNLAGSGLQASTINGFGNGSGSGSVIGSIKASDTVTANNRQEVETNRASTSSGLTLQDSGSGNSTVTPVAGDSAGSSVSRFDEIVDNPLSNTLFEPVEESQQSVGDQEAVAGVVLLPAAFRITFVPDATIPAETADQNLDSSQDLPPVQNVTGDQEELTASTANIQATPMDNELANVAEIANVIEGVAVDQPAQTIGVAAAIVDLADTELQAADATPMETANSITEENTSVVAGLESTISVEDNPGDGNTWLFGRPETDYTAQLGSFNSLAAAEVFVAENELAASKAHILETVSNDKTWFYVLYDSFALQGDAEVAVRRLGLTEPWIRKISVLQDKRCASWETTNESAFSINCR
jgi:septal ring-binding cell division protein DamX